MISSEDEKTLQARSYKELNEGYPNIQYTNPANYLIINNDKAISLTKGTYSSQITITTFNNKQFLNDIILSIEKEGFTFYPESLVLRLGDNSYSFHIAVDKDLMTGTY